MNTVLPSFDQALHNMTHHQVRPWAMNDERVLRALATIARQDFVPCEAQAMLYADIEIPFGQAPSQRMLEPKVEARLLQALDLKPSDRVLEIGTGTGYSAALLSVLAQEVTTVEIDAFYAEQAKARLSRLGLDSIEVFQGNGADMQGAWLQKAPFDVIVLSGAVDQVPDFLLPYLKPDGGRLVAMVGQAPIMYCHVVNAKGVGHQPFDTVVPVLSGFSQLSTFKF